MFDKFWWPVIADIGLSDFITSERLFHKRLPSEKYAVGFLAESIYGLLAVNSSNKKYDKNKVFFNMPKFEAHYQIHSR